MISAARSLRAGASGRGRQTRRRSGGQLARRQAPEVCRRQADDADPQRHRLVPGKGRAGRPMARRGVQGSGVGSAAASAPPKAADSSSAASAAAPAAPPSIRIASTSRVAHLGAGAPQAGPDDAHEIARRKPAGAEALGEVGQIVGGKGVLQLGKRAERQAEPRSRPSMIAPTSPRRLLTAIVTAPGSRARRPIPASPRR